MLRLFAIICFALLPLRAFAFDHTRLDGLLKAHVSGGKVDYTALRTKQADLDAYLASVATASGTLPMGFYINAYNALVLDALLAEPALPKNVTDVKGFFDAKKYRVAGKDVTLNDLEGAIRTQYKDARVHFAFNCGAKSCPPLPSKAFPEDAAALSTMLDSLTHAFLNGSGVKVDDAKKEIQVTKLMEWYGGDFGDLKAYLRTNVTDTTKAASLKAGLDAGYTVTFQSYNWVPNQK